MLQHSRTGSGQKESIDLNELADEYFRLAFHGQRAKDKSFNANFKTEFEKGLGLVDLNPQDIGRVLVNLINNAFFSVNEKKKLNIPGYEPTVTVSTKRRKGSIVLTVSDNGIGVPQKLRDKIFQPFFTTKPTGQGTGLGLSLSYDIVKAHGGEIRLENNKDGGASFVIELPA
jgi:signal transduction histidine kinase